MQNFTIKTLVVFGMFGLSIVCRAGIIGGPIQNPANNHYYYLLGSDTWTASQAQALSLGGNLVTINDSAENSWVASTFLSYGGKSRDLWAGASDAATEGIFKWVNGEPFAYSNWEPGQPDNGGGYYPNENYLVMYGGTTTEHLAGWVPGKWNDIQNVASSFTNTGTFREIFGVVELVPEPSVTALILAAGPLLLWFRNRRAG
jgi:hypothetical protein